VSPSNADVETKQVANEVLVESNDEDAVAVVLESVAQVAEELTAQLDVLSRL
jgi:hydroxymethylpyrimidine pyrophosphatase-like HAD family hydrolase